MTSRAQFAVQACRAAETPSEPQMRGGTRARLLPQILLKIQEQEPSRQKGLYLKTQERGFTATNGVFLYLLARLEVMINIFTFLQNQSPALQLNSRYYQPGSHYTFIKVTAHSKQPSPGRREPNCEPLASPATSVSAGINHLGELVMESRLITVSNVALAVSGGG